ncbi:MAG: DNA polymerase III subunit gamma/tau [Mogibacterium sp.]|nr:DNA polymerase III subunit gamma/tau [Mogibacterium sp.]
MHLALYRSERPERFEEIIGQKHIVRILRNQLAQGTVSQAYLFTGTRGTGKTTTARILAKAVNCTADLPDRDKPCCTCPNCEAIRQGRFLDVVELDAASNNGVEDLRAIIDSVQYPPVIGQYKVYIIDEVHMLSAAAENAFLKTLEEPPEYAIFILATTNPEKVRATIRSRCMTLNFKRVSETELISGMRQICSRKGVRITDEALGVVASRADGSVRDGLSILEQCISAGDELVTEDLVLEYIGSAGTGFYLELTDAIRSGETGRVLTLVTQAVREGKDARQLLADGLAHYRDLMVVKYVQDPKGVVNASEENISRLRAQAEAFTAEELEFSIRLLSEYLNLGRYSTQPRILLETALIRLMNGAQAPLTGMPQAAPRASGSIRRPAPPQAPARQAPPAQSAPIRPKAAPQIAREAEPSKKPAKPAPSQQPFDAEKLWTDICEEISRSDLSFQIMVGGNSRVDFFRNDELRIIVKKNKLALAENSRPLIERAAKQLLGSRTFVTLRGGDITTMQAKAPDPEPEPAETDVPQHAMPDWDDAAAEVSYEEILADAEPAQVGEDQYLEELAESASALFGMPVDIIDN